MAKPRSPLGARIALIAAALGMGTMAADRKGTGADPVARTATGLIAAGGLIWLAWAAVKQRLGRKA
ncbi:hypothetical protein [Neotabrizicola sp. VNH66]|uniref:hypothetical protein n=1 Tax=Neotabrizicola sp. VNH66 TaxID=3400918 RepID=UPI003C12AD33